MRFILVIISIIDWKRVRKITALTLFTFHVNVSHLHAVIYSTAFFSDGSGILYSNVLFLETGFYSGLDGIICFTIRSTKLLKWSNAKMNDTTRTWKINSFHTYHFQIQKRPGTPQQASEMQYPLLMAELTKKENSVNSVFICNFTFRFLMPVLFLQFFSSYR